MRTLILTITVLIASSTPAWAPPIGYPVAPEVRPVTPLPPMPVPTPMPAPLPLPAPMPLPAPLPVAPAPVAAAPIVAPQAVVIVPPPPPSCKKLSDCASEAGQCLADKLASRDDGTSEQRFFIEYNENGVPRIVRYTADIPSEKNDAEAAECAADLERCLGETC